MRLRAVALGIVAWLGVIAPAGAAVRGDRVLLAALQKDLALRGLCPCIHAAAWIDESYARITVDRARWRRLPPAGHERFAKLAFERAAERYQADWGTPDFYRELYVVDGSGHVLLRFVPD